MRCPNYTEGVGLQRKVRRMATEVAVTPAQVAAARAYIEISGGKDKVNEAVVRLAEAETRSHSGSQASDHATELLGPPGALGGIDKEFGFAFLAIFDHNDQYICCPALFCCLLHFDEMHHFCWSEI